MSASLAAMAAFPAYSETAGLDPYFKELADPNEQGWARAEADIRRAWSRSGSPSMDLLLKRGETALDEGDTDAAIEHFTALTDHAPDFAEGWNGRATAYFMAGLYGPAARDIAHVLKLEPRHWAALAGLGAMLEEMDDAPRALEAYQASFALNPHQQDVKDAIARLQKTHQGTAL
ncbi:tetratricopeptide repeat protein [Thioclava indica]|nr:tetratricopeptide repeat protein [Thioclava indica]